MQFDQTLLEDSIRAICLRTKTQGFRVKRKFTFVGEDPLCWRIVDRGEKKHPDDAEVIAREILSAAYTSGIKAGAVHISNFLDCVVFSLAPKSHCDPIVWHHYKFDYPSANEEHTLITP